MSESARQFLRAATRPDHDAVDRVFSAFDLADRHGYVAFLKAQAIAFLPVEAAIDRSSPLEVLPDWPLRRRSASLLQDLTTLGAAVREGDDLPAFDSAEALLGAVYVLEGSRLGGAMLARSIPEGFPTSFLSAPHSTHWRNLLIVLEKRLVTTGQRVIAATAARNVFALFEKGARDFADSRRDR